MTKIFVCHRILNISSGTENMNFTVFWFIFTLADFLKKQEKFVVM